MDKSLRSFTLLSTALIAFFFVILTVFGYVYRYSTINTYNGILLILMLMIIIVTLLFILSMAAVFYTYRHRYIHPAFLWLAKSGMRVLLPFVIFLSGFLKRDKDAIRGFYIDINNILVRISVKRYPPGSILMLLPHCLQDSGCGYKVTNNIDNCKRCGRCCIGNIAEIVEDTGVKAAVVTGGTVARNMIEKSRPGLIVSVACERDLASGIADVVGIPVIGMTNERPNGPCNNTTVDVDGLRKKLDDVIDKGNG